MGDKWQTLQDKINEWSDKTFGLDIDAPSLIEHISEEVEELRADPYNPLNFADILILVMRLAKGMELNMDDLHEVSEAKFIVNSRDRVWKQKPENGRRYEVIKNGN